jgi:thymidylate synthase (FAD)
MRLIKPSFSIWDQQEGLEGVYKQIEKVGRVCYKSEDKITEDSAKPFVERMVKSGHGAMLEHGTIYLNVPEQTYTETLEDEFGKFNNPNNGLVDRYRKNKYSKVNSVAADEELRKKYPKVRPFKLTHHYITTNLRVIVENGWEEDLEWQCEPTEHHEKRITAKFICDRGVSHEFVRHRVFSFAQESTRYCNYSKDKFGNELTFILPPWVDERQLGEQNSQELLIQMGSLSNPTYTQEDLNELYFLFSLASSEVQYFNLINNGWKPQQARAVLPNSLKTELVVTGFVSDWKRFFRLRSRIAKTGKPHPQAQELADPLMDEFVKRGIMETLL